MSGWMQLKSTIKWPEGVVYVLDNEGRENKYGMSFLIKYNGNIIKKNLTEKLKEVNRLTQFTEQTCKELEMEILQQEDEADEAEEYLYLSRNIPNHLTTSYNNYGEEPNIDEANQILLRLHDKKKHIEKELNNIQSINSKYDIVLKRPSNFFLRLDDPFLNTCPDPLLISLQKYDYFNRNMIRNKKRNKKSNKKNPIEEEFKSFLYNIKIMENEETVFDNKTFIFSEHGKSDIQVKLLLEEGKNIQRNLLQYKTDYLEAKNEEEEEEEKEKEKEERQGEIREMKYSNNKEGNIGTHRNDTHHYYINEKRKTMTENRSKKKTYEELSILPYSDILILKKKSLHKEINVVGFITPFMVNGNIQKMIKSIDRYLKYKFDNTLIYTNLCNIITLMSYLENKNIIHGNIKPSNIFISTNGCHLLIGNFVPTSKVHTYYFYVINKQRSFPKYIAPEFLFYLRKKSQILNPEKKKMKRLNKFFIPNDIFCLGLTIYYILTMTDDILNCIDMEQIFYMKLENMKKYITIPKLYQLMKAMLSYAPKKRKTWKQILNIINDKQEGNPWTNILTFH